MNIDIECVFSDWRIFLKYSLKLNMALIVDRRIFLKYSLKLNMALIVERVHRLGIKCLHQKAPSLSVKIRWATKQLPRFAINQMGVQFSTGDENLKTTLNKIL